MHDLVIRGGTVFDGTGTGGRTADVVVNDGRITEVGKASGRGREEVNAVSLAVSPVLWMFILTSMRKSFGIPPSVRLPYG